MSAMTAEEASPAEVRAWAKQNGWPDLGPRGNIPRDARSAYDAAHGDYPPGTTPADFGPDAPDEQPPAPPDAGSTVPGPVPPAPPVGGREEPRPRRPRGRGLLGGRRRPKPGPAADGKKKATARAAGRRARLSVERLIEDAYSELAWAAKPIPPLSRMFYAQAPLAGVILDPVVKDTIVDRVVLQPYARAEEKYKAATALLGPPVALMAVMAAAPQPATDENGNMILKPVLDDHDQPVIDPASGRPAMMPVMADPGPAYKLAMVALRYSVGALVDAAGGDAVERITQRAMDSIEREKRVDEFLAFVLGLPGAPEDHVDTEGDEAAAAGLRLVGAEAPQ